MSGPSVPYSGNPASYAESVNVLSGSDTPGSTTLNTTSEGTLDRTANLRASTARVGQSWRLAFAATGPSNIASAATPQLFKPAFDASNGVWLFPYSAFATPTSTWVSGLSFSRGGDDGAFWTQLGGSASITPGDSAGILDMAACPDPATPGIVWAAVLTKNGAQLQVSSTFYTSSSWISKFTLSTSGSTVTDVEMAGIGSRVVVAISGTAGSVFGVYSGGSGASFGLVSSIMFTLGQKWSVKSNGSTLIVLPTFQVPRPTTPTLWTTADGVNFTAVNISSIIPAGAYAAGLAWSPLQSLWYMAVQVTNSVTAFYSSPDGITWTNVSTSSGPNLLIADFECSSNGLVLTTQDAAVLTNALESLIYFSTDWGVNWRPAGVGLQANLPSSAVGYSRARLASAPTQLLVGNSQYGRFSVVAGLPAHV
jgi:hypothetical protein